MFKAKSSLLSNSDGSAELTIGNTTLVVSVSGPIEPKARQELPNYAGIELVIRPAVGLSTTREKLLEDKLRSVLQIVIVRSKYPRQLILIVVQFILVDESSLNSILDSASLYTCNQLSAAINCSYLALIDAGVALYSSFASVSMGIKNNEHIYHPSTEILLDCKSHHVFCFSVVDGCPKDMILIESQGSFTEEELFQGLLGLSMECSKLHADQRTYIQKMVTADFAWKL